MLPGRRSIRNWPGRMACGQRRDVQADAVGVPRQPDVVRDRDRGLDQQARHAVSRLPSVLAEPSRAAFMGWLVYRLRGSGRAAAGCGEPFSRTSARVSGRALPRASRPSWTGPRAMRCRRSTLCPSRASMRRISRFLPSLRTISSQVLSPWRLEPLDALRLDVAVAQPDALEELLPGPRAVGCAGHLDQVGLLDAEARVHQPIGQVAVVGQQQQPLAVLVEPADGVDALADVRHQVDRPAAGRRGRGWCRGSRAAC